MSLASVKKRTETSNKSNGLALFYGLKSPEWNEWALREGAARVFTVRKMREKHLKQVFEIENTCFVSPWSYDSLKKDLAENVIAFYLVALCRGEVIGYAGMWHVVNEGHILNIAVREGYRRMGVGTGILKRLVAYARDKDMMGLTLEVRINNLAARGMYEKCGFKQEGVRKGYYEDTKEDVIIMWKYL